MYELMSLVKGLGGVEATREALADFRARVRAAGLGELHVNAVVWGVQILPGEQKIANEGELLAALGIDSVSSYVWIHHQELPSFPETPYADVSARSAKDWEKFSRQYELPYLPNVTMGWDSSPRTVQSDRFDNLGYPFMGMLSENTPEQFRLALERMKRFLERDMNGFRAPHGQRLERMDGRQELPWSPTRSTVWPTWRRSRKFSELSRPRDAAYGRYVPPRLESPRSTGDINKPKVRAANENGAGSPSMRRGCPRSCRMTWTAPLRLWYRSLTSCLRRRSGTGCHEFIGQDAVSRAEMRVLNRHVVTLPPSDSALKMRCASSTSFVVMQIVTWFRFEPLGRGTYFREHQVGFADPDHGVADQILRRIRKRGVGIGAASRRMIA